MNPASSPSVLRCPCGCGTRVTVGEPCCPWARRALSFGQRAAVVLRTDLVLSHPDSPAITEAYDALAEVIRAAVTARPGTPT